MIESLKGRLAKLEAGLQGISLSSPSPGFQFLPNPNGKHVVAMPVKNAPAKNADEGFMALEWELEASWIDPDAGRVSVWGRQTMGVPYQVVSTWGPYETLYFSCMGTAFRVYGDTDGFGTPPYMWPCFWACDPIHWWQGASPVYTGTRRSKIFPSATGYSHLIRAGSLSSVTGTLPWWDPQIARFADHYEGGGSSDALAWVRVNTQHLANAELGTLANMLFAQEEEMTWGLETWTILYCVGYAGARTASLGSVTAATPLTMNHYLNGVSGGNSTGSFTLRLMNRPSLFYPFANYLPPFNNPYHIYD